MYMPTSCLDRGSFRKNTGTLDFSKRIEHRIFRKNIDNIIFLSYNHTQIHRAMSCLWSIDPIFPILIKKGADGTVFLVRARAVSIRI